MLKGLRRITRIIQITFILERHGLGKLILSLHLFSPLRFLIYLNPWNWFRGHPASRGKSVRFALEELGPIFVKFGQALSTRPDILPTDIARELIKLQDDVPPFPSHEATSIVEQAYGKPIEKIFATFIEKPLASASIAQVHAATLDDGQEVVLKILRPKIEKQIRRDIDLLYTIAHLAEKYIAESRRLRPVEVVAEFEKTLAEECDFMREAANASLLRRNFLHSELLYIPRIYWRYTQRHIVVMERIRGIPITHIDELRKRNFDIKKLAERGVEIFFTQVFRDSFFHADMHPGNIFVSYHNPDNPQYIAVDFGNAGTLGKQDKHYLAANFLAFFNRDYHRIAELHVASGWVPPNTPVHEFEAAIRTVCEPVFERPLSELSFAHMLLRLFETGRRFNMEVQPQLILLQKTLFAIEGLGRQLYPQLDLWHTAKPFLEQWTKDQVGLNALVSNLSHQAPQWAAQLPEIPSLVYEVLASAKQHLSQQTVHHEQTIQAMNKQNGSRFRDILLGAALALLGIAGFIFFI